VALRALAHRNYRLYFFGQMVSLTGTWMQSVAQSWLAYRLTGSAALLGLVGVVSQVPSLLLAPAGGVIADRAERRRILIATQVASMLLACGLAALTLADRIRVPHILVLAALLGAVNGIDIPVRQSFVVEMVGRDTLANAIALNSSVFNGARVVGPAVAGILVAAIGEGWCFAANAVSFLAVIASLAAMRLPAFRPNPATTGPWASLVAGFSYVRRTRPVRALLLLLGVVSLTGMPYTVLMPIFADRILHGGARGLGLLMGATGVGAVTGAIVLAARRGTGGLGRWLAFCAAGFGVALILFAFSQSFWLSMALLVPAGFFFVNQMAASNTLLQALVPDEYRGRVMAAYAMMFMGMAPLGALAAGAAADRIGAPWTVAAGGLCCIAGAAVFATRIAALRADARRMLVEIELP
jgi:MFS family permease